MTLNRPLAAWGIFNPVTNAQRQSRNVIKIALIDAKHDIAVLATRVEDLEQENAALFDLLSRIRVALGDNGKRMQPELIEYCEQLAQAAAVTTA